MHGLESLNFFFFKSLNWKNNILLSRFTFSLLFYIIVNNSHYIYICVMYLMLSFAFK